MKRIFTFLLFRLIVFFVVVPWLLAAGVDDLRDKLRNPNRDSTGAQFHNRGERYTILSIERKQLTNVVVESASGKSNEEKVFGIDIVISIKRKHPEEKTHTPRSLNVYLYDKRKEYLKTCEKYLVEVKRDVFIEGFKDFRLGRAYHLFFVMDYEAYNEAKTFIAVIGSQDEEFVALKGGRGRLEDFHFPGKTDMAKIDGLSGQRIINE